MNASEVQSLVDEARAITAELKSATTIDQRTELLKRAERLESRVAEGKRAQDRAALSSQLDNLGTISPVAGSSVSTSAFEELKAASWEIGRTAMVSPELVLGLETKDIITTAGDAKPLRLPGIIPEGTDGRRLYPALPTQRLQGALRVDALVSSGRVLADPDDMQLNIAGTSEKPTTSSAATLETFEPVMIATVSDPYPNAIVNLPAFADLVNNDLATAYQDGVDNLVVQTLIGEAGTTDDAGDDLFEQLRKAVTAIQSAGFNPTLAAISPEDAEELDLSRSGGSTTSDGPFVLPPAPRSQAASPLWDLRLRVVKGLAAPIVLDPNAVQLHIDPVKFDADPFTGFTTNETAFRYEGPVAVVIKQAGGIYVVDAGSS